MNGGIGAATLVWVALLAVLSLVAAMVLVRMMRLVRRTRELERFQRTTAELSTGLAGISGPLVADLDALRRHAGDPIELGRSLPAARARLDALVATGNALRAPAALAPTAAAITGELGRAVRATELVEHGLALVVDGRSDRSPEAETSLKRGTLNLRHAAEALAGISASVAEIRPADLANPAATAARNRPSGTVPTYIVPDEDVAEDRFGPRM